MPWPQVDLQSAASKQLRTVRGSRLAALRRRLLAALWPSARGHRRVQSSAHPLTSDATRASSGLLSDVHWGRAMQRNSGTPACTGPARGHAINHAVAECLRLPPLKALRCVGIPLGSRRSRMSDLSSLIHQLNTWFLIA